MIKIKEKDNLGLEVVWKVTVETKSSILKRKSEAQILIPMRISCEDIYTFTALYEFFKDLEGFSYDDVSETITKMLGNDFYLYATFSGKGVKSAYIYDVRSDKTQVPVFSENKDDEPKRLWILTFSLNCEEDVTFNKYLYSSIEETNDIKEDFDTIINNFAGDGAAFRNSLKRSNRMKYCSPHIDVFDEEDVLDATLLRFECRDLYLVYTSDHDEVGL